MKTPHLVVMAASLTVLAGCGAVPSFSNSRTTDAGRLDNARYLQIEVDDVELGLPCRVVDRRNASTRNVLWRAEFEADFCYQKADETRTIIEAEGWACRPLSAQERPDEVLLPNGSTLVTASVVAVWRCLDGLPATDEQAKALPPLPSTRPADLKTPPHSPLSDLLSNPPLLASVERDLEVIGQNVVDEQTRVDTAFGDLDGDGAVDAVIVVTRNTDLSRPHRLLMAYLRTGEAYNLVDVSVLRTSAERSVDTLDLTIDDGAISLEDCCYSPRKEVVLVLEDRKLSRVGISLE